MHEEFGNDVAPCDTCFGTGIVWMLRSWTELALRESPEVLLVDTGCVVRDIDLGGLPRGKVPTRNVISKNDDRAAWHI
jgi:hypothetical protein